MSNETPETMPAPPPDEQDALEPEPDPFPSDVYPAPLTEQLAFRLSIGDMARLDACIQRRATREFVRATRADYGREGTLRIVAAEELGLVCCANPECPSNHPLQRKL